MEFKASPQTGTGSADFLKLKDGESVMGVFRGDVCEFYGLWKDSKFLLGEGNSFRFRINFVTKDETGKYIAKVLEQGVTVYNQLKDLHAMYDLPNTIVTIKRTGSKQQDTAYSILPIKKSEVSAQTEKLLAVVELKDLTPQVKPKNEPPPFAPMESMEEIPF